MILLKQVDTNVSCLITIAIATTKGPLKPILMSRELLMRVMGVTHNKTMCERYKAGGHVRNWLWKMGSEALQRPPGDY
jgi:hypothetical protein